MDHVSKFTDVRPSIKSQFDNQCEFAAQEENIVETFRA